MHDRKVQVFDKVQIGKRNILILCGFTAASRLWFDGGEGIGRAAWVG
jgi:hypothetical protein